MPTIDDSKCILVIGATSGIGRALAQRIAKLPNKPQVIAVGRRQERLDELATEGLETIQFDVDTDTESLKAFVERTVVAYPKLDTIIFSAGVQYESNPITPLNFDRLRSEFNLNYLSVVTIINLIVPHFSKLAAGGQPCFFIPITSGLAILPGAWVANYCATKAALHNYTMSLRVQLEGQNIHVMEIIPPLVESELHERSSANVERVSKVWIPLDKYADETLEALQKGEAHIPTSMSKIAFDRHEEGKLDWVRQFLQQQKKSESG
ncbi:NAD(P)-binding protein [Pluteus cervinus]|uniref:NAD(P)-binding protein n=1 Tax=Pluteus cervinus TaxID=181527 RepID=A0ACD3A739_9AGAR|nr:NAD(P)-binding protein [Pluteus cervinus]